VDCSVCGPDYLTVPVSVPAFTQPTSCSMLSQTQSLTLTWREVEGKRSGLFLSLGSATILLTFCPVLRDCQNEIKRSNYVRICRRRLHNLPVNPVFKKQTGFLDYDEWFGNRSIKLSNMLQVQYISAHHLGRSIGIDSQPPYKRYTTRDIARQHIYNILYLHNSFPDRKVS